MDGGGGELRRRRRRLFVAAELDDAARAACANAAERLRAKRWSAKWVPPENYHLTVAFIGPVDEARVAEIVAALRAAAPAVAPMTVPLDTVGAFPSERRPRIAWLGSAAPVPAFGTMCGAVRDRIGALGFELDARAEPHVTLARSDGRMPLPRVEMPNAALLGIDHLTLYESFTDPAGARYEAIERIALASTGETV